MWLRRGIPSGLWGVEDDGGVFRRGSGLTVRVYDFFAGCGGASRGFQAAGMEIVFALDFNVDAEGTFRANFPDADFERADIRTVDPRRVRERVDARGSGPALFSGCAPCQPFSRQNRKRDGEARDERVPLLLNFAGLVEACRPDVVFMENVPGMQAVDHASGPFCEFLDRLDGAGYQVDFRTVNMADYGVPQPRVRLVLVASRHGRLRLPAATHGPGAGRGQHRTVRDAISHLPPIKAGEAHAEVPNHQASSLSARSLERIRATPPGGGHRDWPEHLRLDCHKGFQGYSDVYGRMSWDGLGPVLTTRCNSYSNGCFGHPEQDRAISVREAACLQTFPDDFVFKGSLESMARQVGNAVPVRFAEQVGLAVMDHLKFAGLG